jgi:hypothetical protein
VFDTNHSSAEFFNSQRPLRSCCTQFATPSAGVLLRRLEEEAEEDEVVVEQVILGTVSELVFHQLVIRVDRTLNPISVFPDHVYLSGLSSGPFTGESLVKQGGEMARATFPTAPNSFVASICFRLSTGARPNTTAASQCCEGPALLWSTAVDNLPAWCAENDFRIGSQL